MLYFDNIISPLSRFYAEFKCYYTLTILKYVI